MRNVQIDSAKLLGFRLSPPLARAKIGDKKVLVGLKIGGKISTKRPSSS